MSYIKLSELDTNEDIMYAWYDDLSYDGMIEHFNLQDHKEHITGIAYELWEGEVGKAWVTEDAAPYLLSAYYIELDEYLGE